MAVPKTWATNEVLATTDLNASLASTAWTAVTFTNSWVNFDTNRTVQYRKVGDEVQIRGMMKSGTIAAAAFTLPSGFRPTRIETFTQASNAALGILDIDTAGVVTPSSGSNVYFATVAKFSVTA